MNEFVLIEASEKLGYLCFLDRRFKSHLFDLTFIKKLSRWLNNTQVKIKAEVAESNTQAQNLMRLLNSLETRVDACERPNLDKEVGAEGCLICSNLLLVW